MKNSITIYLIFFCFFSTFFPCQSQVQQSLAGIIKEKKGDVLPGVMVVIKNEANAPVAYTTTDREGRFSVSFSSEFKDCTINFSYLGFKPLSMSVDKFKTGGVITMTEESYQLKEVTVKLPEIKSSGDTLTYNVASFRSATDRTIEDIIKKLPGISVSEQGIISYNGEAINRFYIEGLDMLSGRYALATRNISPDDVASVNVYENHQPKRVLKDVEYSDKAALNLKLKKKSMLKPIGYLKGGAGIDNDHDVMWIGEAFGMFIAPKNQMLVTLKGNDAGYSYINETRSFTDNETSAGSKAFTIYPSNPFGRANIASSRYLDNRSISTSINSITKLSEMTNLTFSADYSDEMDRYHNSSEITYSAESSDGTTISESILNRPHLREAKLNFLIENNAPTRYFSDKLLFTGHFDSNRYNVNDGRTIKQNVSSNDYNLSNKLDGTVRISKHLINFKSVIQASTTPHNRLTASNDEGEFINQNVKGFNFFTKEEIGYAWSLSTRSSLGLKAIFNLDYTRFKSNADRPADMRENDIQGYDIQTIIEPEYKLTLPSGIRFTLSAPLRLRDLNFDNHTDSKDYSLNRFDADFKAQVNYTFPFNLKTNISFGRQNRLGGISDFIENPIYLTFRKQSVLGSGKTNRRSTWHASSNFSYRNTVEGLFASATLIYRQMTSNRLSGLSVSSQDNITTSFSNIDNKMRSLNSGISLSKKVYTWHTTFSVDGNVEIFKKDIIRQSIMMNLDVKSYMGKISVNSSPIGNYLIIDLEGRYSGSHSTTGKNFFSDSTNDITGRLSLSTQPIKNIEISLHGYFSHSTISNDVTKNSFYLDGNVNFHKGRFEIELSARNLTNETKYSYSYIIDSDRYNYSFDLRPIEAFLTLKYNF